MAELAAGVDCAEVEVESFLDLVLGPGLEVDASGVGAAA